MSRQNEPLCAAIERDKAEKAVREVLAEHSLPLARITELALEAEYARRSGNVTRVASALGIGRTTIYRWLWGKRSK